MNKCNTCGSSLIKGDLQKRDASSEQFKVIIENIPTKVCSKKCIGYYWSFLDLGVEVIDLLNCSPVYIAKRKGFFKFTQHCLTCKVELINNRTKDTYDFSRDKNNKSAIKLTISAPVLVCMQCRKNYLPAQEHNGDSYYNELGDIISEALKDNLIWK